MGPWTSSCMQARTCDGVSWMLLLAGKGLHRPVSACREGFTKGFHGSVPMLESVYRGLSGSVPACRGR
eukprot:scaffold195076_cov13-Tisochrysis_lutea.AAC.1